MSNTKKDNITKVKSTKVKSIKATNNVATIGTEPNNEQLSTEVQTEASAAPVVTVVGEKKARGPGVRHADQADGTIKFLEHRNAYVGYLHNRIVCTRKTEEGVKKYLDNCDRVKLIRGKKAAS